ncbi:MAG: M56 family metallopeptidase [Muricauda sp.]|nr:M56 family metallopeptidase [Allomuricauda sp.]
MLIFLLKSTACLAIFLAFYKLLLEKESVHHFKRFYLLGTLMASLIIPSIVFVEYVEVTQNSFSDTLTAVNDTETPTLLPVAEETEVEWGAILWSVYVLGVLGFGFRFLRNLGQIWLRIRKNPKSKHHFITRVLLAQQLPPHTFFSYVFLNKKQYEAQNIPEEVLLHEETHARQRHSLDILFIELAQVLLWFNPLIYLLKSYVRLNHEFLADRAVINKSLNLAHYQNTLLSYLSHDHFEKYQSTGIANAINYSSIKKRFTVMKTNTSKTSFVFRSLLVLPLTALLLLGFTETNEIPITNKEISEPIIFSTTDNLEITDGLTPRSVELAGIIVDSETLLPLENVTISGSDGKILSKTNNKGYYHIEFEILSSGDIYFDFSVTKEGYNPISQKEHWGNLKGNVGSAMYFALQQKKSDATQLSSMTTNPKSLDYETVLTNYDKVEEKFKFHQKLEGAKRGNQNVFIQLDGAYYLVNDSWIQLKSKNDLVMVDNKTIMPAFKLNKSIKRKQIVGMTPLEAGKEADFAIYTLKSQASSIEDLQSSASREEMKEYNALAKKYNDMDHNNMVINKKEVMRLKVIYGKMSEKQRADAEPFPNFPPPPPAPDATKPPKAPSAVKKVKGTQPNLPPAPPVPPTPPSPMEHIKKMAAKGATFMYNGKEISAKKAIEVIKNNRKINIDSRDANGDHPVVKLSTEPIVIEN